MCETGGGINAAAGQQALGANREPSAIEAARSKASAHGSVAEAHTWLAEQLAREPPSPAAQRVILAWIMGWKIAGRDY
jgi:hypothetical protein